MYLQNGGKRAAIVWHRRAGKDLLSTNWCAVAAHQRIGLYWHILPTYEQGRKIVWEGMTYNGTKFLSAFPGFDSPGAPDSIVKRKRDDKMFLELNCGSIYQVVGTDDPDRLVGPNPVGVIFSEYSLHNPAAWNLIRPILVENGGWAIFIYTMRGKNHGFQMARMAEKDPDWFYENLTINDTKKDDGSPVVTKEDVQSEIDAGMPLELVQQEFYNSPDAALVGAYYKDQIAAAEQSGRVANIPWDSHLPVDTFWDLGIGDTNCIIFTQRVGLEIRIIDFEKDSGKGLDHYAKVLKEKPYAYGEHHGPHDIKVREFSTGKSRLQIAAGLGIRFRVCPKLAIEEGINAVRMSFSRFWIDKNKCEHLIDAMKSYTKEWDGEKKIFNNTPKHDWASHPCDALRSLGLMYREKNPVKPPQTHAISDYNPMQGHLPPHIAHRQKQSISEYDILKR